MRRILICLICGHDVGRETLTRYLAHAFFHGFLFAVVEVPGIAS